MSDAFGISFLDWIMTFEDMDFPGWPLPEAAWLFEAMQLAMHFLRVSIQEDEKTQLNRASYLREVDKTMSNKQAFAQVKGAGPPPVHEIARPVHLDAIIVSSEDLCTHEIYADAQALSCLDPCIGLEIKGHSLSITLVCSSFCVATTECPVEFPSESTATQKQFTQ